LSEEKAREFHHVTAQLLFMSSRARQDIQLPQWPSYLKESRPQMIMTEEDHKLPQRNKIHEVKPILGQFIYHQVVSRYFRYDLHGLQIARAIVAMQCPLKRGQWSVS